MDTSDPKIIETAGEWVVLLSDPSADESTRLQFHAWLEEDERHGVAFKAAKAIWADLGAALETDGLYDDDITMTVRVPPSAELLPQGTSTVFLTRKRAGIMAAAACLTVALMLGSFFGLNQTGAGDINQLVYETQIGDVQTVKLPDGSTMFVNTGTRVEVGFTRHERTVELISGEAHFDVISDSERPFTVVAGEQVIQAIGTAFSVTRGSELVTVEVSEGRVLMKAQPNGEREAIDSLVPILRGNAGEERIQSVIDAGGTLLKAGNRAEVHPTSQTVALVDLLPLEDIERSLAWRNGGLIFERERLEDVINVMSAYTQTEIIIIDPELRDMHVIGYFELTEIDQMLNILTGSFEVDIVRLNDTLIEIRRPDRISD